MAWQRLLISLSGLVAGLGTLLGCRAVVRTELASVRHGIAMTDSQEVQFRAVLRGKIECLPCPKEDNGHPVLSQPCVDMIICLKRRRVLQNNWFMWWEPGSSLVVGRMYTFRIRLRPGYLEHLHDSSPLYWSGPPYLELVSVR